MGPSNGDIFDINAVGRHAQQDDSLSDGPSVRSTVRVLIKAKQSQHVSISSEASSTVHHITKVDTQHEEDDIEYTFDEFLTTYRRFLRSDAWEFPAKELLDRIATLKIGFHKCDSNGDGVISRDEFEIAIQKLGLIINEEEFHGIFAVLDADKTGTVDWYEFVSAALNDSLAKASKKLSACLKLDRLADVPSFLRPVMIGAPVPVQSAGSSRHLAASKKSNRTGLDVEYSRLAFHGACAS